MRYARLTLSALVLGAVACSSVQTVRDPAQYMSGRPDFVLAVFNDGSEMPISNPQLRGDTLFGTWQGLNEPVAAPLAQLRRIDAIQRDSKRTALLVVGLATASGVITYGFTRFTVNTGVVCSWDRGVDDRGNPGDLGNERCFATR